MASTPKQNLPWKARLSMSIFDFVLSLSRRSNDTIDRRLLDFIVRKVAPNPNFVDGVSSSDVIVDPTRNLLFRLFIPSSNFIDIGTSLPVFVFFHGGGFAFMSSSSIQYDTLCRLFCRSFPAIIVSVNYRLAPEHRFPSQYDDGLEILKFLDKNENILGKFADISKCFLSGDSAGGNLAHHVAIQVSSENLQILKVIGLVSIQPFFGGEERTESEIRSKWAPVVFAESVNVSGPNAIDILNVDYPNTLLCVGGFDPLVDWQKRYYEWLRKSGKEVELIEYPNMIHGFYCFPEIPETSHFISKIKSFMTKQMFSV